MKASRNILYSYLLLFLFLSFEVSAQDDLLIPYRKGNLWGFADTSLQIRVKPNYDSVGFFYADRALVKSNHKVGYINKLGTEVIPLKYDKAGSFGLFGQAYVYLNGRRYNINTNGEEEREKAGCGGSFDILIPEIIIDEQNGKYKIYRSKSYSFTRMYTDSIPGFFDKVLLNASGLIFVCKESKWAIYNSQLKRIHDFLFDDIGFSTSVFDTNIENTRYQIKDCFGYLNKEGNFITPAIFEKADIFTNQAVLVKLPDKQPCYMDTKGRLYFED